MGPNKTVGKQLRLRRLHPKSLQAARVFGVAFAMAMAGAFLSACGSSVTPRGSTSLTSGSGPADLGLDGSKSNALAECVAFDSSSVRLQGKMTTYYWSGQFQEDKVRLRIQNLDPSLQANSGTIVSFYRWLIDPTTGRIDQDQTPVSFSLENLTGQPLTTSAQPIRAQFTSLEASEIPELRAQNGLVGSTTLDFLNMTSFVLDVGSTHQVLQVVLSQRNDQGDVSRFGHTDVLIPAFFANPNSYRASRPALLAGLHPYDSVRSLNLTDADWVSRSKGACF